MALFYDVNSINPTRKANLEDEEAVHQTLINILNTRSTERPFNDMGLDLEDHLFELIDNLGALGLRATLRDMINTFSEGLFTLDTYNTVITPVPEEGRYDTVLVVKLNGSNDQSYSFEGSLSR